MTEETSVPQIINVGDWVRFYDKGQLVIGEVRYIRQESRQQSSWAVGWTYASLIPVTVICTDEGEVDADRVLEVRCL